MRKDRKSRNERADKGQGIRKERQESVQNYKREGELRQITAEKREGSCAKLQRRRVCMQIIIFTFYLILKRPLGPALAVATPSTDHPCALRVGSNPDCRQQ